MTIEHITIEGSTYVSAVGYDEETSTLEVVFQPNKYGRRSVWRYAPVHPSMYERMISGTESVGKIMKWEIEKDHGLNAAPHGWIEAGGSTVAAS